MNTLKKLADLAAAIDELSKAKENIEDELSSILNPLFSEQANLAGKIIKEDEFKTINTSYNNPLWKLNSPGYSTGEYYGYNDTWYEEWAYRDGESGSAIALLPEFFEGTLEQKENAIRTFYRAFIEDQQKEKDDAKQKEIDKAKALLAAAGITV